MRVCVYHGGQGTKHGLLLIVSRSSGRGQDARQTDKSTAGACFPKQQSHPCATLIARSFAACSCTADRLHARTHTHTYTQMCLIRHEVGEVGENKFLDR